LQRIEFFCERTLELKSAEVEVQNSYTQQGLTRNVNRRPDQYLINLVFEQIVTLICSVSIARATLPVLLLIASWATVFSTQFSHDDAQLQLRSAMNNVKPISSLPGFLLPDDASPTAIVAVAPVAPTLTKAQHNLVKQLSPWYQVSADELSQYVVGAYTAARDLKVDPLLVLAIMSIESSFDPEAQSHAGAQGLMQVLTRVHAEKFAPFGGVKAAFDINANIHVGTKIIKEYLTREGSIEGALKSYVGAALLSDDGGYGYKVMAQMERLRAIAAGKPIPNIPDRKPETEVVLAKTEKANLETVLVELKATSDVASVPISVTGSVAQPPVNQLIANQFTAQTSGQVIPANFSGAKQATGPTIAEPIIKNAAHVDTVAPLEL
jgi:hypothetical protein